VWPRKPLEGCISVSDMSFLCCVVLVNESLNLISVTSSTPHATLKLHAATSAWCYLMLCIRRGMSFRPDVLKTVLLALILRQEPVLGKFLITDKFVKTCGIARLHFLQGVSHAILAFRVFSRITN